MAEEIGAWHLLKLYEGLVVLESISNVLCTFQPEPVRLKTVRKCQSISIHHNREMSSNVITRHGALTLVHRHAALGLT